MPAWVETKTEIIRFSVNQQIPKKGNFSWNVDIEELQDELDRIMRDNYDLHFQIVGCVPLTSGIAHQKAECEFRSGINGGYAGAGYGYGWGLSNISGAIIFLQKVEQVSAEEFQARSEQRRRENMISGLKSELKEVELNILSIGNRIRSIAWSQSAQIEVISGLKTRYKVGAETFLFKKGAEAYLLESREDYERVLQTEEEMLNRKRAIEERLASLG